MKWSHLEINYHPIWDDNSFAPMSAPGAMRSEPCYFIDLPACRTHAYLAFEFFELQASPLLNIFKWILAWDYVLQWRHLHAFLRDIHKHLVGTNVKSVKNKVNIYYWWKWGDVKTDKRILCALWRCMEL